MQILTLGHPQEAVADATAASEPTRQAFQELQRRAVLAQGQSGRSILEAKPETGLADLEALPELKHGQLLNPDLKG